jgi:hypothetical protein
MTTQREKQERQWTIVLIGSLYAMANYGGTLFLFVSFLPPLLHAGVRKKKREKKKVLSPFKQFGRHGHPDLLGK